ncbi:MULTISPECIES: glycerophosphoryl diester phosphodiesterase membrane domain-containing protein [unclassified Nocardiopsis]|uniref:glycerophosphoryl diester phosphodiesterase membrane domain-containing protein n=1 Tax=unclassified Nocardiopsis TaxID=2649073 RepID=UPI00135A317D|nr:MULTISPECIES: glycerophosphoryl diester phosphodiesterase membrane domain-containing protein [unclassified Nocardiopsis]
MTQEDDHRNAPGSSPADPDGGAAPGAAGPESWAAPGQSPPDPSGSSSSAADSGPDGGRTGPAPHERRGLPDFAPPGQGQAPQDREHGLHGRGQAPYGQPGPYQPGHGGQVPAGQQYGYGPQGGSPYGGAPGSGPAPAQASPWQQPGQYQSSGYGPPPGAPPGQGHHPGYGQPAGPGQPPHYGYGAPRAPKPGVVPLRPLSLGDILNGAFSVVRHNPKTTVGLSLIVMAIASILSSVGFSGYMSDYGVFVDQIAADPTAFDPDDPFPFSTWSIVALYGGTLLSQAGIVLATGLLTTVVGMAVLGHKLGPSQAWAAVRERIWPIIGLALVQLLIFLGLSLVAGAVVFGGLFLGVVVALGANEAAGVAIVIVAGLVGLLGGLALAAWIYIRLYFAMPVIVLERLGVGESLARSWRLTQGSWWRIFGIALLAALLVAVVSSILSLPFSMASVLPLLFPEEVWAHVVAGAVVYVGNVLVYGLTTPFAVGVATLLYVDLRMRREGLDLRLHEAARAGYEAGPEIYLPESRT